MISALFFDLGGVMLTNGWDVAARKRASETFDLDWDEFQHRHQALVDDFETGKLVLEEYVRLAVMYEKRSFSREDFIQFMYEQSKSLPESLAFAKKLRDSGKYLMATLNNESRELNDYRVRTFQLREYFELFFNSGNVGVRKPETAIYELALSVTQRKADECVFIDDREFNLQLAREDGFRTIQFESVEQLTQGLRSLGVSV